MFSVFSNNILHSIFFSSQESQFKDCFRDSRGDFKERMRLLSLPGVLSLLDK